VSSKKVSRPAGAWEDLFGAVGAPDVEPPAQPGLETLAAALQNLAPSDLTSVEGRRDFASRVLLVLRDNVLPAIGYDISKPAHAALTELMLGLHDIDAHGATPDLFRPTTPQTRRPPSAARNIRRGIVAELVRHLVESGAAQTNKEAFRYIAERIGLARVTTGAIQSDFGKRREVGPATPTSARIDTQERADAAIVVLRNLFATEKGRR
jgi:hypothetical protein